MSKKVKKTDFRDEFLEEVRSLKRDAFARSGDDFAKHIERLREIQKRYRDRVVAAPPHDGIDAA